MHPLFPYFPNQANGNSNNLLPNAMQIQSQVGFINPQISVPFCGPNPNMGNTNVPNRPSGLMNVPNLQNGQLGNSILGSAPSMLHPAQSHLGFGPQNFNAAPGFPTNGPFGNLGRNLNNLNATQLFGQMLGHSSVSFQNGQSGWQNLVPNIAQYVNMTLPNHSHASSPFGNMVGCANQMAQAMAPQTAAFVTNPQLGLVQANGTLQQSSLAQDNRGFSMMGVNALSQLPSSIQQMQGNLLMQSTSGSSQPQQNAAMSLQGNCGKNVGTHVPAPKYKQNNSFRRDLKKETPKGRFQKSQHPHAHNVRGNHKFSNQNGGKGIGKHVVRNSGLDNSANPSSGGKRRSLAMHYTEKEVQQWREERRKNYPTKVNIEQKLDRQRNLEVADSDAKMRRQQLKDILAKQAELGFEVPEIPSHYLSDTEGQVLGREQKRRQSDKRERFQNRFTKRRRFDRNERFAEKRELAEKESFSRHNQYKKKQWVENDDSPNTFTTLRKPSLLEKLLSADVKKDKTHLLQAFRFMVMNSFFKDWPEKPLKFPEVIVKEARSEGEVVEERSSSVEKTVPGASTNTIIGELDGLDDNRGTCKDGDDEDDDTPYETTGNNFEKLDCKKELNGKYEEEEGEITD
ncbi:hypothetical protein Ancab_023836 [Ancistrocladus abbreviatus]